MKICYFGDYNPQYIRNDVIIKGLIKNKVDLSICRSSSKGFYRFLELTKKFLFSSHKSDFIIVGSSDSSRPLVVLIKILSRKPIIWDAHYSLYDTIVGDRKLVRERSLKSFYYWFLDWMGCVLADKILLDTNHHIEYFSKTFHIRKSKFIRILVGADEELLKATTNITSKPSANSGTFLVSFHGNYIPLQGIEYIVSAAKILESYSDIRFNLIGGGQVDKKIMDLANKLNIANVKFIDRIPYSEIPYYLEIADISLGIFANTDKALRVIPNKIYEAMAMGKAIVTADTPAIHELFQDKKNILLCKPADSEDLAQKILELRNNENLRYTIAQEAYRLFQSKCLPEIVVKPILEVEFK